MKRDGKLTDFFECNDEISGKNTGTDFLAYLGLDLGVAESALTRRGLCVR